MKEPRGIEIEWDTPLLVYAVEVNLLNTTKKNTEAL
jgi:hypothetical protein